MSKAYVIGAGITGLTSALALRRFAPTLRRVIVVDPNCFNNHTQPVGIGIWQNAVECLSRLFAHPEALFASSRWSRPAAYRRATDGLWLSQASLQDPFNAERILLMQRPQLMREMLRECFDAGVELRDDLRLEGWTGMGDGRQRLYFSETSCTDNRDGAEIVEDGDVVVLATGKGIGERGRRMEPEMGVIGGVVKLQMGTSPFESLGSQGRRFAMIPLKDTHTYWFATMRADMFQEITGTGGSEEEMRRSLPDDVLERLEEVFTDFHEPVGCVLGESKIQGISLDCSWNPSRSASLLSRISPSKKVYALGDCSSYMSHNLAQGASLAIEQAYLVGRGLNEQGELSTDVLQLLNQRRTRCRAVTEFTKLLAKFPKAAGLMAVVPPRINGFVFDRASSSRSTGRRYTTRYISEKQKRIW